jgi:hypothetical protein
MNTHLNGISRIDSLNTHGWFVRHYVNGFTFSKLFSDGKYKNKENGLIKALIYKLEREDTLNRLPKMRALNKNNKSGIVGVSLVVKKDTKGKDYTTYITSWIDSCNLQRSKSFSSKKYGKREALNLAKNHRYLMNID